MPVFPFLCVHFWKDVEEAEEAFFFFFLHLWLHKICHFSLSSFCFRLFSRLASANSYYLCKYPWYFGGGSAIPTRTGFTSCPPSMGSGCACWIILVFSGPTTIASTQKCWLSEYRTNIWERQRIFPTVCSGPVVTDMWDNGINLRTWTKYF